MKEKLLICVYSLFLIISCSPERENTDNQSTLKEGKGERYYGGIFRLNESEYIKIFSHTILQMLIHTGLLLRSMKDYSNLMMKIYRLFRVLRKTMK